MRIQTTIWNVDSINNWHGKAAWIIKMTTDWHSHETVNPQLDHSDQIDQLGEWSYISM